MSAFLKLLASASPDSRFFNRQTVLLAFEVRINDKFQDLRDSKQYQLALLRFEKPDQPEVKHREAAQELVALIRAYVKQKDIQEV